MTTRIWTWAIALGLSALARGQQGDEIHLEIARTQEQLRARRAEVDELLSARMRHELGLPVDDASYFQTGGSPTESSLDEARRQLESQEIQNANLLQRFQSLKAQVELLRHDAQSEGAEQTDDPGTWINVPQPGTMPPAAPGPESQITDRDPPTTDPGVRRAANPLAGLDAVKGQIHGSRDHGLVARALYRAARRLMDDAERERQEGQGREEQARAADDLARQKLERALESLQAHLDAQSDPAYIDLFYRGKCLEGMFRLDEVHGGLTLRDRPSEYQRREQEVRDPFIAITAGDLRIVKGAEILGTWGQAAQTALDHFRWTNRNAAYEPRRPIESITWGDK